MIKFLRVCQKKTDSNVGLFGRVTKRKSIFNENNMAARLRFKLHLNKQQDLWNNVFLDRQDQSGDVYHNAQQHVWRKPNTTYQHKHLILTAEHCGGGLMIWPCFAVTGPMHLAVIELLSQP